MARNAWYPYRDPADFPPPGSASVGGISDVPGLQDALDAKADTTAVTSGLAPKANTADVIAKTVPMVIPFLVDAGEDAIAPGVKGFFRIPFAHTFKSWSVVGDPSGSIVFDIWRGTLADHTAGTIVAGDSICASNKPTLSSARAAEDTSITDWVEAGAAGAVYWINVDSATAITKATLSLTLQVD